MFEDSLVESAGRIRTRSKWYVVGSFALQAALLGTLILVPYLYPASLPKEALATPLAAPLPPVAPAHLRQAQAAHAENPVQLTALVAPSLIPRRIIEEDNASSQPPGMDIDSVAEAKGEVQGAMVLLGSTSPLPPVAPRPKPSGPVRVSAGVAKGRLLSPIEPVYPAIARTARIQGTVVIEAIISKQGLVEQAHIVTGPPMLAQAALAAVSRARYVPYKLNGEPVDVETTINIVFSLDN
jgi:periplasmic protein TonB